MVIKRKSWKLLVSGVNFQAFRNRIKKKLTDVDGRSEKIKIKKLGNEDVMIRTKEGGLCCLCFRSASYKDKKQYGLMQSD